MAAGDGQLGIVKQHPILALSLRKWGWHTWINALPLHGRARCWHARGAALHEGSSALRVTEHYPTFKFGSCCNPVFSLRHILQKRWRS